MATYLTTVNIAEFDVTVEEGPWGIPLTTYAPTDSTEEELAAIVTRDSMIGAAKLKI